MGKQSALTPYVCLATVAHDVLDETPKILKSITLSLLLARRQKTSWTRCRITPPQARFQQSDHSILPQNQSQDQNISTQQNHLVTACLYPNTQIWSERVSTFPALCVTVKRKSQKWWSLLGRSVHHTGTSSTPVTSWLTITDRTSRKCCASTIKLSGFHQVGDPLVPGKSFPHSCLRSRKIVILSNVQARRIW